MAAGLQIFKTLIFCHKGIFGVLSSKILLELFENLVFEKIGENENIQVLGKAIPIKCFGISNNKPNSFILEQVFSSMELRHFRTGQKKTF